MTWEPLEAPKKGGRGALWFSPPPERRPIPALSPSRPRGARLLTGLIAGAIATTLLLAAGDAFGEQRVEPAPRVSGGQDGGPAHSPPADSVPHRAHFRPTDPRIGPARGPGPDRGPRANATPRADGAARADGPPRADGGANRWH